MRKNSRNSAGKGLLIPEGDAWYQKRTRVGAWIKGRRIGGHWRVWADCRRTNETRVPRYQLSISTRPLGGGGETIGRKPRTPQFKRVAGR